MPILVMRPSSIARTQVVLDTGESFNLELIEDMGAVSAETFKLNAGFIYLKTVLRSLTKTGVSMAFKQTANEAESSEQMLILGLIGFGAQIFAETSEQADLRMSRYFPSKALVGGINLEPGTYSFTVNYYDKAGRLLHHLRYENVPVQANRLNLSEAVCIK
ncbi:hypothetical protein K7I13_06105 [Brucepastera parasyntrophica]|uniref:hypothetical protein n=1 Tax=Brucepastera parasyntrophica TaxID=2880008 RepID=UPI00210C4701|nr:hypothetical protein [Brucepastera parasyntrophica]ULQ60836.1 hypothetical protein K7I13_06105 [Brucepastera parasyntrophica]